jgi:hypothetical protein
VHEERPTEIDLSVLLRAVRSGLTDSELGSRSIEREEHQSEGRKGRRTD